MPTGTFYTKEKVETLLEKSIRNPILLTNEDLNLYKGDDKLGFYYGVGDNASNNKPTNVTSFGLLVLKTDSGNYSQLMFAGKEGYYDLIKRDYVNSVWNEWENVSESRKLNVNIDCDHEYEITGKTGHEYAVAIPDGPVLIKRINGQTRRKSLNLIDGVSFNHTTSQFGSAYVFNKGDLINGKQYTLNFQTKNTGAHLYVNEVLFSWKDFFCNGSEYSMVFTCQNSSNMILFKNAVDNAGKLNSNTIYNVQILEGDYTNKEIPPYQEYDDTLVNSKCNLKSTSRNLWDEEWESGGINVNTGQNYVNEKRMRTKNYIPIIPNKDFYLNFFGSTRGALIYYYDYNKNFLGYNESTASKIKINNTYNGCFIRIEFYESYGTTYKNDVVYSYGDCSEYIPYEESSMLVDKELGEYDYIDNVGHLLVKQTSQVFTFDGSGDENWAIVGSQSSGNTNLFKWTYFTSVQVEGNKGVSNVFGEADDSIWVNDEKCFGIAQGDRAVLIRVSKDECPDLNSFKTWLSNHNFQFVYKKTTPTTEPIQLEAGYQVWNSGLQIQETETIPYVLEKEYAISLYSQVLAVTSIVNSIPDDVASKSWVEAYLPSDIATQSWIEENYPRASVQDIESLRGSN